MQLQLLGDTFASSRRKSLCGMLGSRCAPVAVFSMVAWSSSSLPLSTEISYWVLFPNLTRRTWRKTKLGMRFQVFLQSCIDIITPVENWACMGTGVFSEHRGRTGKVPGGMQCHQTHYSGRKGGRVRRFHRTWEPETFLCLCLPCINKQTNKTKHRGWDWRHGSVGEPFAHRGPDFHFQAHK